MTDNPNDQDKKHQPPPKRDPKLPPPPVDATNEIQSVRRPDEREDQRKKDR